MFFNLPQGYEIRIRMEGPVMKGRVYNEAGVCVGHCSSDANEFLIYQEEA